MRSTHESTLHRLFCAWPSWQFTSRRLQLLVLPTSQHISRYSCTLNIPVHYRPNTDVVGVINNKACDLDHVFCSDTGTTLSVVVNVNPGHVVAGPALIALHWSVGPVEVNAGITSGDVVDTRGWLWFCSG